MRTLLHSHNVWGFITDGYLELVSHGEEMALTNVEQEFLRENRKKDKKYIGLIQQGLDDVIFSKVPTSKS